MHDSFLIALALTAISELGDKTQFASLALVGQFKQPIKVLVGCFLGFLIIDGFSAYLGEALYYLLDRRIMRLISAAIFIILACVVAKQKAENKLNVKERGIVTPVITSMLTIMLLELGDKTQLTTALLSARFGDALSVMLGVLSALTFVVTITITIGKKIVERLPMRTAKLLTVIAYTLGGVILLVEGVTGLELALLKSV